MSGLDYREIAYQIADERPEGFRISMVRVNFDHMADEEIPPRIKKRISDRFEEVAQPVLNNNVTVVEDYRINQLWEYEIQCSCGSDPFYDDHNEEYYCPICERKPQGILDY